VPFGGVFRIIDFTLSNMPNSGRSRFYSTSGVTDE
jgi:ADP-glucose pyrophosphorylase